MASRVGQLQSQIPYDMRAKIQTQVLSFAQRQVRETLQDDLLFLRAVALLELKTANRLRNAVVQGRRQLRRFVQKFRVIMRVKILNDTDQCHF